MQAILFTKALPGLDVAQTGTAASDFGFDGLDLAVRPGFCVDPRNVGSTLVGAVNAWSSIGLTTPLISLSVDANDADDPATIGIYEAAGTAGVGMIKIGYFPFSVGEEYWGQVGAARDALERFARLSERTGVKTLCHTHSGLNLGSNCAGAMHLVRDFDPTHIGVYVDMGHMAVEGSDPRMGLSMARQHLSAIGAKDARFTKLDDPEAPAPWGKHSVFVGTGAAQWPQILGLLKSWEFDGPFSVHGEYTSDQTVIDTVGGYDTGEEADALREEGIRRDLDYLRKRWAAI